MINLISTSILITKRVPMVVSKVRKHVTHEDLERLEQATAEAFSILAGLLAEAAGSGKLAAHFAASLDAYRQISPNPARDKLLKDAYRLVLKKAYHAHPDAVVIQDLYATEFESQTDPIH